MKQLKDNLPFDGNDLMELAGGRSFERGEDYYTSGAVGKIARTGNHFEGTVKGSARYNLTLDIKNDELKFRCTCPYDFGGICKHCVAFGLAVLDGKYSIIAENGTTSGTLTKERFENCYSSADTKKKISFLKQLLNKDIDLQNQFVAYAESRSEKLDDVTGIDIGKIKAQVFEDLSSLDFDAAVEDYNDSYDSYYNDEGAYEEGYALIEDVIDTYFKQAEEFLRKGNLLDAFRILLGVYEGAQQLPEPNDEYYLFEEGYNEKVGELFSVALKPLAEKIGDIVKSDEAVISVLDLYFERFSLYGLTTGDQSPRVQYEPIMFEEVFLLLLTNSITAAYLFRKIEEHGLKNRSTAFVLLKIAELTNNETLWVETAETFAEFEQTIARQLLEKYKSSCSENDFYRVAQLAFKKWQGAFDHYLIQNLEKELRIELYIEALKHYVKRKQDISSYKELRSIISENELNLFINEIASGNHHAFYVQLLKLEKRYEDILHCVEKNKDSYSIDELIRPIVNVYPNECFTIITEKCRKAMVTYNRNRDLYKYMAKWLKVLQLVEAKQSEARQFFQLLYNSKPNLPALKDEMRKAGLIDA